MSVRALLMRLFLIVAVLVNGPGVAGASMHMHAEHMRDAMGHATPMTTTQTMAEGMACHDAGEITLAALEHHPLAAGQPDAAPQTDDCCETGNCCACMHHCYAAVDGPALADITVRYRQIAEPLLSVHASAALTNLFRPPIG
ncbi:MULTISPECIES: CopL family metal-binding regulatory protein [Stenotrophomonas]|uniref:CopL family metal-binding regulatory protein n=2 Tax=Lysobacteraceae TaxID=32033 RepID=UPI00061AFE8C|nr:CopL family metal-binding regulatory protein [uncultured Acidovorax sp.]HAV70765.1 hypothetical protein [Stenotrophomonas sp.]